MIRNVIFDIGGVFIEWDQNKAFREFGFSDETIRKIQQSIIASGGPTAESIRMTIEAGANAVTYTPPSTAELFKSMMANYRE